ncbi:DEAD/DEAH box helicase [Rhizobium sp. 16-449-1b]|uniref:DEAD/DEAH box helicase n=1 Tax=Rhizobium sp. 16-449-1b TaxID=2819989 RepID=UPI001ADB8132|nr:DEAD/DEAH box helicase [Rhizobium sp. 16-449-1b]MBO9198227.1 DEAD/DEAH box helicase [Rhizobium sp. 16-449-1b]
MAEAIVAQSGVKNPALASQLRNSLSGAESEGVLIPPPILEGAFPFMPSDKMLSELSGNLLAPATVDALIGDGSGRGYSFPASRRPYLHQLDAWKTLTSADTKSALITAGTGSGKTECFLVPLLDSLFRRQERTTGVEAIMLYPLNALIASQQERLDAWTKPAAGKIRYCLYNGNLPETHKSVVQRDKLSSNPQQVPDRKTLRESPPPLLVTNLTMLEYMLVRPQDRPIINQSKGKLKWIILDEAHTLVGSAAAEVALLLRRVIEAFEVDPKNVRFIATSATIGDGPKVKDDLRRFLADVAGTDLSAVEVISGDRLLPTRTASGGKAPSPSAIVDLPPTELFDKLSSYDPVWSLVAGLKNQPVQTQDLDRLGRTMGVDGETLAMALTRATSKSGETLAPLRVHSFHRAFSGLWTCTNPGCPDAMGSEWTAGRLLFEREERCPKCRMPVAELYSCNECGEAFMIADEKGDRLAPPRNLPPNDEFLFEADRSTSDEDEDSDGEQIDLDTPSVSHCFSLIGHGLMPIFVDTSTGMTADGDGQGRYRLSAHAGGGKGPCPACSATAKSGDKLYPFRFGAPFTISNAAPMLLESMPGAEGLVQPPLPQTPPDLPTGGRQLISFTDSRQGTARMAAKLQMESERAFVRSFIYQAVQHKASGTESNAKAEELRARIEKVKSYADWEDGPLASVVREAEAELAKISGGGTIAWSELRGQLADRTEVRDWLPDVWGSRADLFKKALASAPSQIAEALLLREMMRRPKLANSPETMGLARFIYPAIEQHAQAPSGFVQRGGTLQDWKAWLSCLVSFSIRSNLAVAVSPDLLQWIMRKGFPKNLSLPGMEPGRRQHRWPLASAAGKQTQVVELLRLGLGMSVGSSSDRAEINDWLQKAWNQLHTLFPKNANGEQALDFNKLEVGPLQNAFHCPVTRRIVDVAPFGLSPYARTKLDRAQPITMPVAPADGDSASRALFLSEDADVAALRGHGLWTDMHDRIALYSPYSRSAEHSAQLSPWQLRHYESEFKSGRINLLNCSTTMEMGVDIGSVNGVLMANVPPSIANYKQRVGRAGRRGQPLSLAFTFAKDRPLDREAFRNPISFLNRSIAAPRVALDSRPIVQRHVNAFLFGRFLNLNSGNPMNMEAGDFFGFSPAPKSARSTAEARPVELMLRWLAKATTAEEHKRALQRLVRGSVLAGRSDLLELCAEALKAAETEFEAEWSGLQSQLQGAEVIGASAAIEAHLKRLCKEFLLSDLADRGFLPGHGFPNHVVAFELDRKDLESEFSNDDRRGLRHGGPKRPLDIAIRDYAPGSETVVDGQVYRVGGVTLNWHRPSSDEGVREIQALRWAARCSHCGDNWTGAGARPEECRTCQDPSIVAESFLKPAGFLRDKHVAIHAEVDKVDYVRAETPRISAGSSQWEALSQPTAGRLRMNRRGTVYYHTRGPDNEGYGLCLKCGRMEAMKPGETICTGLIDHKPLRARENFLQPCDGNRETFAVQPSLHLGYEIHTDVLELQPAESPTVGAANAIAIAMREATARHLGIEPDEIGYGIGPSRNAMSNSTLSIFLHDRAAGGAGYVVQTANEIRTILRSARNILNCPRACDHACSSCVLVSDAPDREEDLDRHKAISFIDNHLALPDVIDPADAFAIGSDISDRPVSEIDDWLSHRSTSALNVWANVSDILDLTDWALTPLFRRWTDNGRLIKLILPVGAVAALDAAQILFLRDYCGRNGVVLAEGQPIRFKNGSWLFAHATDGVRSRAWASRDQSILDAGSGWGANHTAPIAHASVDIPTDSRDVSHDDLKPKAGAAVVVLDAKLDGAAEGFGAAMAARMRRAMADIGIDSADQVVAAKYQDRYARSPIVLKLLVDTVASLNVDGDLALSIVTSSDRGGYSRTHVASDVQSDDTLLGLARDYGTKRGVATTMAVGQLAHKRSLSLRLRSGSTVNVDLDQGFGWLEYVGGDKMFDPGASTLSNADWLQRLRGRVQRRHAHDSQMVLWLKP